MPLRPLTFVGERDAPDDLSSVHTRRPLLGTGDRPRELEALATRRSVFVETAGSRKPEVHVERAGKGESRIWRVDVPIDNRLQGARPGLTMRRDSREAVLSGVDEKLPFAGFRPDWADALFVPRRAAPERPQTLTRFDGRRVTPLWVFGQDNRWQFRDPSWPWGLVGRIFNNQGYSGTGALVGDRIVITAGHMVPWGDNPWWMRFVPAYYDGVSLHGPGVESYVSDAYGYDVHGNVTGYDWAVLRLYEPLGSWLGYYGYNGYSESWNDQPDWSIIGYPGAIANAQRPSFQGSITVGDVDSDNNGGEELESNTADITPGDSGGPMFAWWGNDPRIVGVVSGEEEYTFLWWTFDQDNIMAGGSGFTSLVGWGRTNWPA
jgi:V8-like Glu-specific endopeptidase